jgi:hypothetical protein
MCLQLHSTALRNRNLLLQNCISKTITGDTTNIMSTHQIFLLLPAQWKNPISKNLSLRMYQNLLCTSDRNKLFIAGREHTTASIGNRKNGFSFASAIQFSTAMFIFTITPRSALGCSQPPDQYVSRSICPAVKRLGREADHSPASSAEVKNTWSYIFTPQNSSR